MSDLSARTAAAVDLSNAFESARDVGYAAGSPQMLALDHAEERWTRNKPVEPDDRSQLIELGLAEDAAAEAAIAAAEAIASAAAAEVACEAAVTAQAAVDAARAAAARAAARARQVAANAAEVAAAVATARQSPLGADPIRELGAGPGRRHSSDTERLTRHRHAATAAAASRGAEAQRVADRVVLVAEVAATAAVNAALLVAAQLERDVAAVADQVASGVQPLRISPDLQVPIAATEPEGAAEAAVPTALARRRAPERVPAACGEVQAKPSLCTGCMGSGQCWVCSGSGSLAARTGPVTTCGVCSGRTLCAICHPSPARAA